MMRRVFAWGLAATLAACGIAAAAGGGGRLQACVSRTDGTMTLAKGKVCPGDEYLMAWDRTAQRGARGEGGPRGARGVKGARGPAGSAGLAGAVGVTGVTGPKGVTGATGPQGATGATGGLGDVGATGPTGPQGATGATGITGSNGPSGITGSIGVTGDLGPIGTMGSGGSAGPAVAGFQIVKTDGTYVTSSNGNDVSLSVTCPTGKLAFSGGAYTNYPAALYSSQPTTDRTGWSIRYRIYPGFAGDGTTVSYTVFAYCHS